MKREEPKTMQRPPTTAQDRVPTTVDDDLPEVDLTLIREMLNLSAEERLDWHERTRRQALELRDAFQSTR